MADMAWPPRKKIKGLKSSLWMPSFRGDATHRTRNLEIPRCAMAHLRSGANAPSRNDGVSWLRVSQRREDLMICKFASAGQLGKVQLFSSLVAAITSRSSSGPGTAGLDVKMSH